MGMFDEIICDYPLPGVVPEFVKSGHLFQTKDLYCLMDTYTITEDGKLSDHPEFTGTISFYTSNVCAGGYGFSFTPDGADAESVEYEATFVSGQLQSIQQISHTKEPALHRKFLRELDSDDSREDREPPEIFCGKNLFILWGGQPLCDGYDGLCVLENDKQLVVKLKDGLFEIIDKSIAWDNTLFLDREHALENRSAEARHLRQRKKKLQAAMDEKLQVAAS